MRCKSIFSVLVVLFFISFIAASYDFSKDGSTLTKTYQISDYLEGRINISFQNESNYSNFTDSLGHSIMLVELLAENPKYEYTVNKSTNKTIDAYYDFLQLDDIYFQMPSTAGNFTYYFNFSGKNLMKERFVINSPFQNTLAKDIAEKKAEFNATKKEISAYNLFLQEIIYGYLNFTKMEESLLVTEANYKIATAEYEYEDVSKNLSKLVLPNQITKITETQSIGYYPERSSINMEALKEIAGGEYEYNYGGYMDAIYFWNQDNLVTKVTYNRILFVYPSNQQSLNIFKFDFEKNNSEQEAYFIVKNMQNMKFYGDYPLGETADSTYTYLKINDLTGSLVFSTTENVDFKTLPAFTSPSILDLEPFEVGEIEPFKESKKWILFGIIVGIVFFIGLTIYLLLQAWYKRKYENYLFKNRNNMYNIMTYIQTSKKKGMTNEDIKKNLKKANWNSEQINYALRKYEGKKIRGIIGSEPARVIPSG